MHATGFGPQRTSNTDRRRRLLNDEVLGTATNEAVASGPVQPAQRYTAAAQPEHQARVTDFLPTKKRTLAALFLLGALGIGVLEAGFAWSHKTSETAYSHLTVLDLNGTNSLAVWAGSVMMLGAGLGAFLIYTLRRHRLDDYRGRYRLWLWVGMAWWVMSVAEVTGLHHDMQVLLVSVTGRDGFGGIPWWLMVGSATIGMVVVRLGLELRACRTALAALGVTLALWGVTAALQFGWAPAVSFPVVMLSIGLKLTGHLCLLLMTSVYARYILLDIQGLIPVRERIPRVKRVKKPKELPVEESPEVDKPVEGKRLMVDAAHTKTTAARRTDLDAPTAHAPVAKAGPTLPPAKTAAAAYSSLTDDDSDDVDESEQDRKLTRAERKKLRRQREQSR